MYSTPTPRSVGSETFEQLGELLERVDLDDLALLEAVERGARDAETLGDLFRREAGAEAEGFQPVADIVKARRHASAWRVTA